MKIGPYEVLGELGRGGMGVVYRGRGPDGGAVAIKVMRVDPGALERFERERRLQGALGDKDGFVGLLDSGSAPGVAWLAMPLVPGGTLRKKLEAGLLPVRETVDLGIELAQALGKAHAKGIVHRDVKPENVLFTATGRALLADLGVAKHFDKGAPGASQSVGLTRSGVAKGTAGYMAPEQLEDARSVGPAADVFALGAVLYECLAGTPAFEGETAIELLAKVAEANLAPIVRKDVPGWLEEVVLRALERDRQDRYHDGAELAYALALGERNEPSRRRGARLAVAGLAGALLLAGVGLALHRTDTSVVPPAPPPPAPPPPPIEPPVSPARPPHPEAPPLSVDQLIDLADKKRLSGDAAGAIAVLTSAIALDRGSALAWCLRGIARGMTGDEAGELEDVNMAIKLDPKVAESWSVRGQLLAKKGENQAAIADLLKATELDPGNARAWLDLGLARWNVGILDDAMADLTRASELDPTLDLAWENLGTIHDAKEDFDKAIAYETKAIELRGDVATYWLNRGVSRRRKGGDDPEAQADLSRAIELDPRLATAYVYRGSARRDQGDLDGAVADWTRAIEIDPRLADAWLKRGEVRLAKRSFSGAVTDATKAIELDPRSAQPWALRAAVQLEMDDADAAIKDATRAIELDRTGVDAWRIRGVARFEKKELEGALADTTHVIELEPRDHDSWLRRAQVNAARNDWDAVLADSARAIDLSPRVPEAWYDRGRARIEKKDFPGAVSDFTKAIELNPSLATAWLDRGKARLSQGDAAGAIADLEHGLELAGDDAGAGDYRRLLKEAKRRGK